MGLPTKKLFFGGWGGAEEVLPWFIVLFNKDGLVFITLYSGSREYIFTLVPRSSFYVLLNCYCYYRKSYSKIYCSTFKL